ncbi:MAG TPA: hypothetical protein VGS79_15470 [Puia sp.]|nr:hypothetical protein [Puia sp.]
MKRLSSILLIIVLLFVLASTFIPAELVRSVTVRNTIQNTVTALKHPEAWRSLDSGKNTHITETRYMLFQISEPEPNGDSIDLTLAIVPDVSPQHNPNNIGISYAYTTTLFFKLLPFLQRPSVESAIVGELQDYLQDNTRFYGYTITTQPLVDSFFLTRQRDIPTRDLLKTLPGLFAGLSDYARANSCQVIAQNISIAPLSHDSISLMAGLNIDRSVIGDKVNTFRQLPSTLGLVAGQYEGPFHDRTGLYRAMEKFIADHRLAKRGLPFERYLSPLPSTDSSMVKIELLYPVTAY